MKFIRRGEGFMKIKGKAEIRYLLARARERREITFNAILICY